MLYNVCDDNHRHECREFGWSAPSSSRPGDVVTARVLLLGRPGCHLCDDARAVVTAVSAELGVAWEERSIEGDADLEQQYAELIPVVLVDGVQHDYWRVDADRLRAALRPPRLGRLGRLGRGSS